VDALDEVVVTNTIPLERSRLVAQKFASFRGPADRRDDPRIAKGESVMSLFSDQDNLFCSAIASGPSAHP
jgi:ribose-phosphate pyrophosphokinase